MFMAYIFPAMQFKIELLNDGDSFAVEALDHLVTPEFELLVARSACKALCVVEGTLMLDPAGFAKILLALPTLFLHSIKNKY